MVQDGGVVRVELEIDRGAAEVCQQVWAVVNVGDGPDQNPVPEDLQEEADR